MEERTAKITVHILVRNSSGEMLLHKRQNTWAAGRRVFCFSFPHRLDTKPCIV